MGFTRTLRFRLRTLIVFISLMCLLLGWYAVNAQRYREEMQALDTLAIRPGSPIYVVLDDDPGGVTYLKESARMRWHGPNWLRTPLDFCSAPILYRVESITLSLSNCSDGITDELARLPDLKRIRLNQSNISHADVLRLKEMFPLAVVECTPLATSGSDAMK